MARKQSIFNATDFDPKIGAPPNPLANRRKIPIVKEADLRLLGEVWNQRFYAAKLTDGREVELTVSGEQLPHPELASTEVSVAIQSAPHIIRGVEQVSWAGGYLFAPGQYASLCDEYEKVSGQRVMPRIINAAAASRPSGVTGYTSP